MRKATFIISAFLLFTSTSTFGQLGYGYSPVDLGVGFGRNTAYGDIETTKNTTSLHLNVGYNITPFVNFIVEYQHGKLAGGDSILTRSGRQFVNKYNSIAFRGQLQAGELIDYSKNPIYNALKNVYLGAGLGILFNNITEVSRNSAQIVGFTTDGKDKSEEVFIPVRIGYEIKLFNQYTEPGIKLDVGYQHQFIMGDNMDGFTAGAYNDTFSQIFIGVKFAIGSPISYRKPIAYQ